MERLKFKTPVLDTRCELHDDVQNGIAITQFAGEFVDYTRAISISEADAIRMRDWLNARYPVAAPVAQTEQQPVRLPELRDADHPSDHALRAYEHGWNCAIAEVQRLNAAPVAHKEAK